MENRFNLIDEPWIPIADIGLVSLKQLFSDGSYRALGGTPVEKIALTKFLLAIAQSACTPENDAKWQQLGANGWQQHAWHTLKNGMTILSVWRNAIFADACGGGCRSQIVWHRNG